MNREHVVQIGFSFDEDKIIGSMCKSLEKKLSDEIEDVISVLENKENLPPVTPKQRTGKWIVPSQVPDMVRGYWAKCSACGHSTFGGGKFCRECGAKMEGDAE